GSLGASYIIMWLWTRRFTAERSPQCACSVKFCPLTAGIDVFAANARNARERVTKVADSVTKMVAILVGFKLDNGIFFVLKLNSANEMRSLSGCMVHIIISSVDVSKRNFSNCLAVTMCTFDFLDAVSAGFTCGRRHCLHRFCKRDRLARRSIVVV
ncbi:hypothetical protein BaRGS_00025399, partial [Batillaria attramentaria]